MKLTASQRKKLPKEAFAIPGKRAYPIHNKGHAMAALARVEEFGSPSEKAMVRRKVKARYPGMKMKSDMD